MAGGFSTYTNTAVAEQSTGELSSICGLLISLTHFCGESSNTQLHITWSRWLMQLRALSRAVAAVPSCRGSATGAD